MQHIKSTIIGIAVLAFIPLVTHADNVTDLKSLIVYVKDILNSIIPLLFGLALIGFIWGVIKYIYAANPTKLSEARSYMLFSIIAIAVMLSVWGLALLLKNTFFANSPAPYTPQDTYSGTNPYTNYNSSGSLYRNPDDPAGELNI